MLPSERVRITRRKRIAHLGIGGVIAAAASVTAIDRADDPEPAAAAVAAPPPTSVAPGVRRVVEHASRSEHRKPIKHRQHVVRHPAPTPTPLAAPPPVPAGWPWPQLAQCESGGDWTIVTGNGFLWGLQFVASTWDANRGALPTAESYLARGAAPTPAEQIQVGQRIQAGAGWGAWPACAAELGLL